jgi:hypothetical protein
MHSEATSQGVGGPGCARPLGLVTCSETPHPTGCSRVGTAEVEMHHETRSPRRAHASRVEIGRNDWAAPEPVTGWSIEPGPLEVRKKGRGDMAEERSPTPPLARCASIGSIKQAHRGATSAESSSQGAALVGT